MMRNRRLGRDVPGVRGWCVRGLMLALALVGMSATASAVRIARPVRGHRAELNGAPDFSHSAAKRSHRTDRTETGQRRDGGRESAHAASRGAGMSHAAVEKRLEQLRAEDAKRSRRKTRAEAVAPRAERRAVETAAAKRERGSVESARVRGGRPAGVDAGAAERAQRHDVASALAKAQASADVDGGVTPAAQDEAEVTAILARRPAARSAAPAAPEQEADAEPDVVQEATAKEAERQRAAIVEAAGGDVEGVEAARQSAAMQSLMRPTHAELAEEAMAPRIPGLYGRDGRLIVPAPLRGSREILVHQNEMADAAGLNRIRNDAQLQSMVAHHLLVSFPETAGLHVNPELPAERRTARPWTVKFAEDTSRAFYKQFHEPLELSSAVRTVAFQKRLQRVNGNAAAVSGDVASPHLTGQALDFGKSGMSMEEIAWMRAYLLPLMQAGKLDVEEEFQQACFHISVYRSYTRGGKSEGEVAELR